MSTRLLSALVAGTALLVTACSGGGGAAPAPDSGGAKSDAPVTKYTRFADFPGQVLATTESGMDLGIQVKAVDAVWTPSLAGVPAKAGSHYVAVYVAVTGELADRGVQKAKIKYLQLRYDNPGGKKCDPYSPDDVPRQCFKEAYPASDLRDDIADNTWRDEKWQADSLMGRDIDRGKTAIGVVGFSMPDGEGAEGLQLCGPTKEDSVDTGKFPCVPIPKPEGSRS
ncbi:hypothetical protein [Amycolatopsis alba]|uniref:Lipoprotein n=1 Tax=Amycolatopsis alba DSM 44262 TaxID=1125972 RepID=A0A229RE59_AMYAL|nr:hypothetical protein [Amycolatopsis alba]OXM44865.1 hypothetical protein CFP75_33125 [Amycolatopsis alba DSM 44262]